MTGNEHTGFYGKLCPDDCRLAFRRMIFRRKFGLVPQNKRPDRTRTRPLPWAGLRLSPRQRRTPRPPLAPAGPWPSRKRTVPGVRHLSSRPSRGVVCAPDPHRLRLDRRNARTELPERRRAPEQPVRNHRPELHHRKIYCNTAPCRRNFPKTSGRFPRTREYHENSAAARDLPPHRPRAPGIRAVSPDLKMPERVSRLKVQSRSYLPRGKNFKCSNSVWTRINGLMPPAASFIKS